ncbi:hypothetical protein J7L68_05250, partial [bacterium]|nr:hypothetical protein [bacterium]
MKKIGILLLAVLLSASIGFAKTAKVEKTLDGWSTAFTIYLVNDTLWGVSDSAKPPTPDPDDPYYVDYENYGSGTPTDFTAIDTVDTTIFGWYVKVWARKMTNSATPEPESCTVNTNTSYSNVYYAYYSAAGPGYPGFTISGDYQVNGSDFYPETYRHYMSINIPLSNIKEIDGINPFGFDDNDSLFVYVEDRYGMFSCYQVEAPDSGSECKYMTFCWESNPGASWPLAPTDPYGQQNPSVLDSIKRSGPINWAGVDPVDGPCPTSVSEKPVIPMVPTLFQNSPNPFNAATDIEFSIPQSENVKLVVTDVLGKRVKTL